jgi:hypothetical protein
LFSADVARSGFTRGEDLHLTSAGVYYAYYQPLGKKFYASMGLRGRVTTPGRQPYPNYRGLGYGIRLPARLRVQRHRRAALRAGKVRPEAATVFE